MAQVSFKRGTTVPSIREEGALYLKEDKDKGKFDLYFGGENQILKLNAEATNLLNIHNINTANNTRTIGLSSWNGGLSSIASYVWGQSWKDTNISSDTGDLVLGLRPGVYTPGGTELCMMIDGDYYSMGYKVLNEFNYSSILDSHYINEHIWNASVKGQTWSRLCLVNYKNVTEGSSYILNISATRGNVVYNDTFLIKAHHSQNGKIIKLSGHNYSSGYQIRLLVNTNGHSYVELFDNCLDIATTAYQTVHCSLIPIFAGAITKYTAFTDGTSPPSGYTVKQTMTVYNDDIQANIRGILSTNSYNSTEPNSLTPGAGTAGALYFRIIS